MSVHNVPSSGGAGVAVHHLSNGSAAARLLIAHATGFHGLCYAPMARALGGAFDAFALDAPGHGVTPAPPDEDVDWHRFGDDVRRVAAHLGSAPGVGRLVGFGHSMGGAALLMAALRDQERFAALVLWEPIVMPTDVPPEANPLAAAARRRRREFPTYEAAIANFASKPPMSAFRTEVVQRYVQGGLAPVDPNRPDGPVTLRCTPEREAATYLAATEHRVWDELPDLHVPVTVVHGRTGGFDLPARLAPDVARRLPRGRLVSHPTLDHFGPFTDPEAAARIVVAAVQASLTA
jgi:pimeloyl-ACP methyl ester carboxylesterase